MIVVQRSQRKVPDLRFPEFNGEWVEKRLGELSALITKGTTPNRFTIGSINYVKIENLEGVRINKAKCLRIDEKVHRGELKRSILKKDDLLFAIAGATVGKVGVVTDEILPANTNQALAIVRLKKKNNLAFVLQILQSKIMKRYIRLSINVGAQPNLNLEQIGAFTFSSPTSDEQQKIAGFLSAVDRRIEGLEKKRDLLKEYKKGLMQKLFNQTLRFTDDEGKPFPDWEEKRLGDVFTRITRRNKEICRKNLTISGPLGLVNQEEYFNKRIAAKDNSGYYLIKNGDFAYNRSYCNGYPFGAIKRLDRYAEGIVSTLYICFELKYNAADSDFMAHYFESGKMGHEIYRIAQEGARNHGLLNVTTFDFFSIKIMISETIAEQKRITECLSALDRKIEQVQTQVARTREFKQGLLQRMFV